MSQMCEITGKMKLSGNRVSHANNKTRHFQRANVQTRAVFVEELGLRFRLRVSNAGMKVLNKVGGLSRYVLSTDAAKLSPRLLKLRKALTGKRTSSHTAKA